MKKEIKAPDIAVKHGMTRLVFEDDFDSLDTIDLHATGEEGYKWYLRRPYRAEPLTPEDFRIENSVLYLEQHNSMYNYGLATVDAKSGAGFTFNKGVLEFRVRVPHYDQSMRSWRELPDGGGPAVWSFPRETICESDGNNNPHWIEADWMEYWGDLDKFPGGHYTFTLHESLRKIENGVVLKERWHNHTLCKHMNGFHDAEWHTMTFLWDKDLVVAYYDDQEIQRVSYGEDRMCDPLPTVKIGERLVGELSFMNTVEQALIINGAKCNPLEIDWIRVWQK